MTGFVSLPALGGWADDPRRHCFEMDPEIFFPDPNDLPRELEAFRICTGCPVRAECLRYAIDNRIRSGIWGGTSAADRQRGSWQPARIYQRRDDRLARRGHRV